MNFFDVFTTMSVNPATQKPLQDICQFIGVPVELETLKKALWKQPARHEHPGMFPFNEETGRIYDALWKAAQSENYSTMERIGRWLLKAICPPADDEGMAAFHRKAKATTPEYRAPEPEEPVKQEIITPNENPQNGGGDWDVSDDEQNNIVIETKPHKNDDVVKRSKKGD